ncbi:MAG TPA: hypothetical protein VIA45_05750 [Thermoanaerobaculia bacterium]
MPRTGPPRRTALAAAALAILAFRVAAGPAGAPWDAGPAPEARLFAEGVVSTEDDESNGAFSPEGSEYYFTKFNPSTTAARWGLLCVARFRDGRWSAPESLPFSGRNLDFAPRLSPDGKTLYFSSSRAAPGKTAHVLRIWSVARTPGGWGEPRVLPAPVNAPDTESNFSASITRDGTIYFASTRDGSGHPHVYRARFAAGAWAEPEKLGPEINSDVSDEDPYVSADERILVFGSRGDGPPTDKDRPETVSGGGVLYARGDLYASVGDGGRWSPARHLGHGVNTFADESSPSLTPDGRYLFFTTERSPFSVPPARRMSAREIDAALRGTLNGHGNVFFVSVDALGLAPAGEKP